MSKLGRNEQCWCGSGKKYKNCHATIEMEMTSFRIKGSEVPDSKLLKSLKHIEGIRKSGEINIAILDYIHEQLLTGISTSEIDRLIYEKTISFNAIPATLNYNGYPKSCCTSINNVVCHGIPSSDVYINDGDIINIDVSTVYKGYYSDSSRMFCIGNVTDEKKCLVQVAKECMEVGINQVRPWGFLGDIGYAINKHAKMHGYTVVQEIGGHGIGLQFHEDPWVSYVSRNRTGLVLVPGLVFTIEPMINLGSRHITTDKKDGWTVYTADGKPSAQWESTVLVTENGCEILAY